MNGRGCPAHFAEVYQEVDSRKPLKSSGRGPHLGVGFFVVMSRGWPSGCRAGVTWARVRWYIGVEVCTHVVVVGGRAFEGASGVLRGVPACREALARLSALRGTGVGGGAVASGGRGRPAPARPDFAAREVV